MFTASSGLSGQFAHHIACRLPSGKPKEGCARPQTHFLFLTSTASSGLSGQFLHQIARLSSGKPKHGDAKPQAHFLGICFFIWKEKERLVFWRDGNIAPVT
jgi:hypothetical protein